MSLIGKKVKVSHFSIDAEGKQDKTKTEDFNAIVIDKFLNVFSSANGVPMQCENFIIQKEDGLLETIHPSYIKQILY